MIRRVSVIPKQPLVLIGVTIIVSTILNWVVLMAVNPGMFPVPLAAIPIAVVVPFLHFPWDLIACLLSQSQQLHWNLLATQRYSQPIVWHQTGLAHACPNKTSVQVADKHKLERSIGTSIIWIPPTH